MCTSWRFNAVEETDDERMITKFRKTCKVCTARAVNNDQEYMKNEWERPRSRDLRFFSSFYIRNGVRFSHLAFQVFFFRSTACPLIPPMTLTKHIIACTSTGETSPFHFFLFFLLPSHRLSECGMTTPCKLSLFSPTQSSLLVV